MATLAAAFDFLNSYDRNIKPYINQYEYIVCDRYIYCYIAYAKAAGLENFLDKMFFNIPLPDVIIYIDIDTSKLGKRYEKRKNKTEDEHIYVMEKFKHSYRSVLEDLKIPQIFINNDGFLDDTFANLTANLKSILWV